MAHNPMLYALLCIEPRTPLAMICLLVHHLWRRSKLMSAIPVSTTYVLAHETAVRLKPQRIQEAWQNVCTRVVSCICIYVQLWVPLLVCSVLA